ncbi:hypothetical protein LTR08_004336 [Meristemomyces frigidus]|nr:hypothetical protein LTR08_004336 [Meristemomyces frigidus]
MPFVKTGLDLLKHTPKNLDLRIVNANRFAALAAFGEEQHTPPQTANTEDGHLSVPDVAAKLVTNAITDQLTNIEDERQWETTKPTRKYGPQRTTGVKSKIPDGHLKNYKIATRTTYIGKSVRFVPRNSTGCSFDRFMRGPKTKSGVAFAEQNPASCVWHWDYRPVLKRMISVTDPEYKFLITAPDGSVWFKKGRFWIIVARTKYTVTEVPIYTYDNHGLENKLEEVKWEYLSLKPLKIVSDQLFVNQVPSHPVLEITSTKDPQEKLRATMVVHYTEIITRNVNVDDLRYVGEISDAANETLQDYVKKHIGRAPDDH